MPEKPNWLKVKAPNLKVFESMQNLFQGLELHTICENANCPNIGECFDAKTATFMILGNICTRGCAFCAVSKGMPAAVDGKEGGHLAEAVKALELRHVVVTSVTRDDLSDGGAGQFADVIQRIRETNPQTTIEVLIPDFKGDVDALEKVVKAKPDILNHNIETVPRLYKTVRPQAEFDRSVKLLALVKELDRKIITKSGMMVGLGETAREMEEVFKDLVSAKCDILTIGQYLRPSAKHIPVHEYVTPEMYERYKERAVELGFKYVAAGPFVRSSYKAFEGLKALRTEDIRYNK